MNKKPKISLIYLIKSLFIFVAIFIIMLLFGVFMMNNNQSLINLNQSFSEKWYLWLMLRVLIYTCCGILLFRIQKKLTNQKDKDTYKRIRNIAIFSVIFIEVIKLI